MCVLRSSHRSSWITAHRVISFCLNYFSKDFISKYNYIPRYRGLGVQHTCFKEDTVRPITTSNTCTLHLEMVTWLCIHGIPTFQALLLLAASYTAPWVWMIKKINKQKTMFTVYFDMYWSTCFLLSPFSHMCVIFSRQLFHQHSMVHQKKPATFYGSQSVLWLGNSGIGESQGCGHVLLVTVLVMLCCS